MIKYFFTCFFTLVLALAGEVNGQDKPNVLFIAIDDLRPELGCYGSEIAITPNLDKLAGDGLLFNRAYCQEAICAPSRASLMTGARPDSIGIVENWTKFRDVNPDIVTLSQHFIANGYEAVQCGKIYHNKDHSDLEHSWNREPSYKKLDLAAPNASYALAENKEIWKKNNERLEAKYGKGIAKTGLVQGPAYEMADVPDQTYRDGYNADLAVETMKEIVGEKKSFFMGLGFYKPHLDFIAPKKYWDLYDSADIPLATQDKAPKDGSAMGLHASFELRVRDGIPKSGPLGPELSRKLKHAYLACVSFIDAQIGRVITELENEGLRENTIIIVWGDHGWHLGDMGIWGKATNYEIATRVPMMVWTPDMPAGSRGKKTDGLVELVDMYPSLCELAGLPLPDHLEGTSFAPLLEDPDQKWEAAAFSQFPNPALREWAANPLQPSMRETFFGPLIEEVEARIINQQKEKWDRDQFENDLMGYTMRTDRYRLVVWKDVKNPDANPVAVELYDHKTDPGETINVASKQSKKVAELLVLVIKGWKGNRPPEFAETKQQFLPFSDLSNQGNWVLNKEISDEFEGSKLDETKWLIQGRNDEYQSKWIGRAPAQFSTENVRLEDGKLKVETRWEPDFAFSAKPDTSNAKLGPKKYENLTTAAVISRKRFHYGYMEIKARAADASISSGFWATGGKSELDVYEFLGKPSLPNKKLLEKEFWSSIHDWSQPGGPTTWTRKLHLPWRVAEEFHVYACEWDENYLKFYADGKFLHGVNKAAIGDAWILTEPMWVWVDSEAFPWHGLPTKEDLPVDYEIEYIRVWQGDGTGAPTVPDWIQKEVDKMTVVLPDLTEVQKAQYGQLVKARAESIAKAKNLNSQTQVQAKTTDAWSNYVRGVKELFTEEQNVKFSAHRDNEAKK